MMLQLIETSSSESMACAQQYSNKSGIIICESDESANILADEMVFYKPSLLDKILYIPDNETLPFDLQRAPASIMSERANLFYRLSLAKKTDNLVIIVSAVNAMRIISSLKFWRDSSITLSPGMNLLTLNKGEPTHAYLSDMGYQHVNKVKAPGDWAIRGHVMDMFPVSISRTLDGEKHVPVRVTFDATHTIVSIRHLDTLTQIASDNPISEIRIFSNREYPLSGAMIEAFRQQSFDLHPDPRSLSSYKIISMKKDDPELCSWIGADIANSETIIQASYADTYTLHGDADKAIDRQVALIHFRHYEVGQDKDRIAAPIEYSWLPKARLKDSLSSLVQVKFKSSGLPSSMERKGTLSDTLAFLKTILSDGVPTLFAMGSAVRIKHMRIICGMIGFKANQVSGFDAFIDSSERIAICHGLVTHGFYDERRKIRLITEREVFGRSIEAAFDKELSEHQKKFILQGLDDIAIGDPIVHASLGVGRFLGFEKINMIGIEEDTVKIGFADNSSTFVRVGDLGMISRYSGLDPDKAPLSRMSDGRWLKQLQEAQNSAFTSAKALIEIRDLRARASGIVLSQPDERYAAFCESFPYEETADQMRAILDIQQDLTSGKPMDRLICGDVGFGKTEVAMRAAFLLADNGYQVAILAPTTLLAEQHYQSFVQRFEDTPFRVLLADRKTLNARHLKDIKEGMVSIIIGTHRLLQADIDFKDLGMIVIDEEHRFGVQQKEKLRSMRGNKHVLAMAATPIPRTLGMAISGIRNISIISTPPARRLSVRTLVKPYSDGVIREAISRELARSGQVFFLHNRIDTMDECVDSIALLYPSARIQKLHGKMSESEMTKIMFDFRNHEFDVLVSTTVIEVGIDVPNANTLIVDQASSLGIAQLHQLRGRVGRSSRQAYAYLLSDKNDSPTTQRRLSAMEASTNLGEGLMLARQDMEIRGIGEILGEEQTGHVHSIGFALYMRLLESAIQSLDLNKDQNQALLSINQVRLPISGVIEDSFIERTGDRLAWYQRILSSDSMEEISYSINDLEDQYGYLTDGVLALKQSAIYQLVAQKWHIESIVPIDNGVRIACQLGYETRDIERLLSMCFKGLIKKAKGPRSFDVQGVDIYQAMSQIAHATAL